MCADSGAAAPGVAWGRHPVAQAWKPGSGAGPRYRGSEWANRGVGFRRCAPAAGSGVSPPPPYLHKCRTILRRPAGRYGETAVPSWNSRVAGRDGHQGPHSEEYTNCNVYANPMPVLMTISLCNQCGFVRPASGTRIPGPRSVLDPEPAEYNRHAGEGAVTTPGTGRVGVRARWGLGLKSRVTGPLGSPIPLQEAGVKCVSETASTRLKQCPQYRPDCGPSLQAVESLRLGKTRSGQKPNSNVGALVRSCCRRGCASGCLCLSGPSED